MPGGNSRSSHVGYIKLILDDAKKPSDVVFSGIT